MKVVSLFVAGDARVIELAEPPYKAGHILLEVQGLCGTDLNSLCGRSPLEAGPFPVEQATSAVVSLHEAPERLRRWSNQPAAFTKIMVQVQD